MKALILLTFISIAFSSCGKERLVASGDKKTEIRSLRDFTGVRSSNSENLHITYGDIFEVTLKGSGNLLPYFKTDVIGSTLSLGYERVSVQHDDIQVFVTLPKLAYISLIGSGSVNIQGQFPLINSFEVSISGSGSVDVEDDFEAPELLVKISGSGSANLEKLKSQHAEINISGSGNAKVNTETTLIARISGSGKVYYWGNPVLDTRVSGSGKVIKY